MRRLLIATLLAVPVLAAATQDASAFFSTCGEFHKKWSFSCPRLIFGVDSGCAAPYTPISYGSPYALNHSAAAAMPWYAGGYPCPAPGYACAPRPMMPQGAAPVQAVTPPPAGTQPVSYQQYGYPAANYSNYYQSGNCNVPAYWYFR
jgi:hypothetical protein